MHEGIEKPPNRSFLFERFGPTLGAVSLFFIQIVEILIIAVAIILPIRYFLIQPFYVKGASMEPNFYDHEYLIIDELSYRFRHPDRGEIVVFRPPTDSKQYFIKRVIALPGETIEVSEGKVTISNTDYPNGIVLSETYLDSVETFGKRRETLAEDEYYVLGDNRDESLDSRSFGPIRRSDIVGRVWVRGLPISRLRVFEGPVYQFLD
ncbi:signal peptidase I [Candidatus Uhrbacteria bacterium]|nr:signal peptidase I [Candidatus Uhrbacteria bacterium]